MIQVSNLEDDLDKFSDVHPFGLIVARVDNSLEEEKDEIPLNNKKKGLCQLLASRAKRSTPKDALGSPPLPPPPPSPALLVNPFAPANLKKRNKDKEVAEKGELVPHTEEVPLKVQKKAKGEGRASSIESKEDR